MRRQRIHLNGVALLCVSVDVDVKRAINATADQKEMSTSALVGSVLRQYLKQVADRAASTREVR